MRLSILYPCLALVAPICLHAAEAELSVPVRVLGTAPAVEPDSNPGRRAAPEPTSVTSGLLPQYQSARAFHSDVTPASSPAMPALRFLLMLPDQPLLIEARVTINGMAFDAIREQRIDRLMAELTNPAPGEPGPGESAPNEPDPAADPPPAAQADKVETTAAADKAAEDEASEPATPNEKDDKEENQEEAKPEVPLIPVPGKSLDARLRRYTAATGRPPSREELHWLLAKWMDGPTLLVLDENFQRFRGAQAPAFHALDRDLDGKVSAEEIRLAQQTLLACDINQNDVVEYSEILEVANDPRRQAKATSPSMPVLIPLLDATSAAKSLRRVAKRYSSSAGWQRFDPNADGVLDAAEFDNLGTLDPDVTLRIAFDAADAAKSSTTVTHLSSNLAIEGAGPRGLGSSITVPLGRTLLEFSAVQSDAFSESDQISVGVVNDGYPLLPVIDPNEDGRLTIRELRNVTDYLRTIDVDGQSGISAEELPATIRVSFGLGPSVHRHLAEIRTVHLPSTTPMVVAPTWFTKMDRNKDGDISPREFLLGAEQFKNLDADEDGLVSVEEAVSAKTSGTED